MGEDARLCLESAKEAMNVILYTSDLEPITMVDFPRWLLDQVERTGQIRVATTRPVPGIPPQTIDIYCVKVLWIDETYKPILVTPDEELALKAIPHWLPGQLSVVQGYKAQIKELTNKVIRGMRKD